MVDLLSYDIADIRSLTLDPFRLLLSHSGCLNQHRQVEIDCHQEEIPAYIAAEKPGV
jgi:hypothetical protein